MSHDPQQNPILRARYRILALAINLIGGVAVIIVAGLLVVVGGSLITALALGFIAIPAKGQAFQPLAKYGVYFIVFVVVAALAVLLIRIANIPGRYLKPSPGATPSSTYVGAMRSGDEAKLLAEPSDRLTSSIVDGSVTEPGE